MKRSSAHRPTATAWLLVTIVLLCCITPAFAASPHEHAGLLCGGCQRFLNAAQLTRLALLSASIVCASVWAARHGSSMAIPSACRLLPTPVSLCVRMNR